MTTFEITISVIVGVLLVWIILEGFLVRSFFDEMKNRLKFRHNGQVYEHIQDFLHIIYRSDTAHQDMSYIKHQLHLKDIRIADLETLNPIVKYLKLKKQIEQETENKTKKQDEMQEKQVKMQKELADLKKQINDLLK